MLKCKNCNSTQITKSGKVNNKQRYHCKVCDCHFTEGDGRTNERVAIKKALCVILHASGKASYRMLAKIFDTSPSLTYRWIAEAGCQQPNNETHGGIKHMEFDKLSDYIKTKESSFDSTKPLAVAAGELWPGYSAIVLLQHINGSKIRKLDI
ncbi:MAG: hypothetical protein FWF98_02330 [Dehalococcoidia bacterium]|nr:hypothetical protein [Dehalococcoidia bacterium]